MSDANQTDTVELYGMKDGIQVHLGQAPMPPRMKAKEIVVSMFGHFDEHDDMDYGDAAMCFSCMTELIDYTVKQVRTQITQLQAEVEALRKDAEWQPIETAPKDGTTIIVGFGRQSGFPVLIVFYNKVHKFWSHYGESKLGLEVNATHWKPLPQPPAIKGEQAA